MSRPTRVLVTGAGGFVGSHLAADQHQRGRHVVALDLCLDSVAHLESPGQFDLVRGDVCDRPLLERALDGVDTVHHLAAAHLSVTEGLDVYRRINVEAVQSLTEAAVQAGVRRFVHCSTVGVFGRIADAPADERTVPRPDVDYETTKLEGEQVVLDAIHKHGLSAVILRPAWVYGPGCPRTAKLFRTISSGRFLMAGRGRRMRHCVYIRDMLEAFDLAADSARAVGSVIIVGDDRAVTVGQLLSQIAGTCGSRPPRSVPLWMLYSAALIAEATFLPLGKQPPLSRRTLKFFTSNTSFDTTRARELLNFRPRYDLARGLEETHRILTERPDWRVPLPGPGRRREAASGSVPQVELHLPTNEPAALVGTGPESRPR